jgi:hypothetical protein
VQRKSPSTTRCIRSGRSGRSVANDSFCWPTRLSQTHCSSDADRPCTHPSFANCGGSNLSSASRAHRPLAHFRSTDVASFSSTHSLGAYRSLACHSSAHRPVFARRSRTHESRSICARQSCAGGGGPVILFGTVRSDYL